VVLDLATVAEDDPVMDHHVRAEPHVATDLRGRAEDQAGGVHWGGRIRFAPVLTAAVLGLGMIGRHHARLLQAMSDVRFAGAVDPGGDRFGAVHDRDLVFSSLDELLSRAKPDFAIVAVPTEEHLPAVQQLAGAGVHVLVEKPLAATAAEARAIIAAVRSAGVHGAVGHVERFNPALLELRRRVGEGQLGEVFLLATERIGPFPDRVRDVGVVKDLATHDLDLVGWLSDSPVQTLAAQTAHKMGRDHEDLVVVTGKVASGLVFSVTVDWLTPTKTRRTRILGERGMLLADTLTADLTFFANGDVTSEWGAAQALKGVSEGDATRYALSRREPLLVELEAFTALLAGNPSPPAPPVVTLDEGLATVVCAESVLRSAQTGETVEVAA
jgi:UDP-N-acetylglucosamine 3-dehydrogenase